MVIILTVSTANGNAVANSGVFLDSISVWRAYTHLGFPRFYGYIG